MRLVSLALIALSCAACGDLNAPPTAAAAQALLPGALDLPTDFARCERGNAGVTTTPRAIERAPIVGLADHVRHVQAPTAAPAPFFPTQQRITHAAIFASAASLQVEVYGSDATGSIGGEIIVSTVDGARDLAALEVVGRCGQFAMQQDVPFVGDAPAQLRLEWTGEHEGVPFRVARIVEVR